MKQRYNLVIIIGFVSGIVTSFLYVNPFTAEISLSELVLQLSGSRGTLSLNCTLTELIRFMLCMIPNYVIMLVLGNEMYHHFCTASIYVFSRYTKRIVWYRNILITLAVKVILFQVTFLISVIALAAVRYRVMFTLEGWVVVCLHLIVYLLWDFTWILIINLLAIKFGSSDAYLTAIIVQFGCIAGLSIANIMQRMMVPEEVITGFVQVNPISRTVLCWYENFWIWKGQSGGSRYGIDAFSSILILGCMCLLVIALGSIIIRNHDLLIENTETGTM